MEKLAQFREVLKQMKQGYRMLIAGYGQVKDLTQGNFELHESFLNGLLKVSPTVRGYQGVAKLVSAQIETLKQAKRSYQVFQQSDCFSAKEMDYLLKIYNRLGRESLLNLEELRVLLTDGSLRMSEAERLLAIDDLLDKQLQGLQFLRAFNAQNHLLRMQRLKEIRDLRSTGQLYASPSFH
ncbi:TerB family tellurite resistance protein [Sphingobacterium sp. DK4209]|uniref:TerB family tellurite resistance protein n=1 Tax=Sphingobacterium zhuxiongii TaxID=2662364 RepID=A0A5Q0QFZ9_9SPHI|nr:MULTISPECIES: TerB family tellurite resistance protein [unclassified Sphingobacterium]MVZ65722.1 TerB family tellurite resistance protein [Sphingobacterium sp. DK4209]QGA27921.1 TerB family tellurite resistance protein [Sphingobacterium sp. dk4302]